MNSYDKTLGWIWKKHSSKGQASTLHSAKETWCLSHRVEKSMTVVIGSLLHNFWGEEMVWEKKHHLGMIFERDVGQVGNLLFPLKGQKSTPRGFRVQGVSSITQLTNGWTMTNPRRIRIFLGLTTLLFERNIRTFDTDRMLGMLGKSTWSSKPVTGETGEGCQNYQDIHGFVILSTAWVVYTWNQAVLDWKNSVEPTVRTWCRLKSSNRCETRRKDPVESGEAAVQPDKWWEK